MRAKEKGHLEWDMLSDKLREYYQNSPWKDSVLCWYPFEENVNYKIVLDPDDFSVETLNKYGREIGSHGRLILAYENPFALRYWNGKANPVTRMPYDTLFGADGRPSAAELRIRLNLAGFKGQKWYYPLTDHWFTREVYSENYLPDEYLSQRFLPYVDEGDFLKFDERLLYREVIRNGAFTFMCGAYFVEARVCAEEKPCPVDYAAITVYREPGRRFATTVRDDGTVRKISLDEEGVKSAERVIKNHEELLSLDIDAIPVKLSDNAVIMPRLNLPTLWDYWVKKLVNGGFDFEEMVSQFDRIKEVIYKVFEKTGKCYWELIPANCFYDKNSDRIIFFDQEYYTEGMSPEVALARAVWALKYSVAFAEDSRAADWILTLTERYGITDRWEELSEAAEAQTRSVFGKDSAFMDAHTNQVAYNINARRNEVWRRVQLADLPGKLKNMGFNSPVIYGYGKRGRDLEYVLKEGGMNASTVVDKNFALYNSLRQVPTEINKDVIIVSILDGDNLAEQLKRETDLPVFTLEELINERN